MKKVVTNLAVVVVMLLALPIAAGADVPQLMNYQGHLTDGSGEPLTGTYSITFTIYDAASDGAAVWTETQSSVTVTDGMFSLLLGTVSPISESVFADPERYLGITVGADPEITPRTRMTSIAYAFSAAHADTADVAKAGIVSSDLFVDGNIHATGGVKSGNTLLLDGNANTLISSIGEIYMGRGATYGSWNPDVKVGIGTNTPAQKLHVHDGAMFVTGTTPLGGPMIVLGGGDIASPNGQWGMEYAPDPDGAGPAQAGLNFWRPWPNTNWGNYFLFLADNTGNVGVGTSSPSSRLSVGSSSEFQVNATGNLVRVNNVPYSFPSAQGGANTLLCNDGSGTLSWAAGAADYWNLGLFATKNILSNVFFHDGHAVNELQLGTVPVGTSNQQTRLRLYPDGQWQVNGWDGAGGYVSTPSGQADYATVKIFGRGTSGLVSYSFQTADWGQNIQSYVGRERTVSYVVKWNGKDRFYVAGKGWLYANGAWFGSDSSSKENITPLEHSLDRILGLTGYSYQFKTEDLCADCDSATSPDFEQRTEIGLLAEEVEAVVPEVVRTLDDDTKAIAYQNLTALLIEGIKEQHTYIDSSLAAISGGGATLDEAYDQGGPGAGRTINATDGYVHIAGDGGLRVNNRVAIGSASPNARYPLNVLDSYNSADEHIGVQASMFNDGTGDIRAMEGYARATTEGSSTNNVWGVCGRADSDGSKRRGIYGYARSVTQGLTTGQSYGVCGQAYYGENAYGIYGAAGGAINNWAGYFDGDVTITDDLHVDGTVYNAAVQFKIDHPLEPEGKYLFHSAIESPDMMNVYNGNVTLEDNGEAFVELPDYFDALNKDFRYQLTCIGGFAPVYIAEEISDNRFRIAGGKSGMKVSWQVTGIRKDAYAEANRIEIEVDKEDDEKGKYLHPEAFGLGEERGIHYEEHQRAMPEIPDGNGR